MKQLRKKKCRRQTSFQHDTYVFGIEHSSHLQYLFFIDFGEE